MGYRNVWEIKVHGEFGSIYRYVGKKARLEKEVYFLENYGKVTVRKLSKEERKQIPFSRIMG